MIDEKIRTILTQRASLHPEDDYNIEKCWIEEVEILCKDMDETIDYLTNRCTAEEFSWISEVFDEVAETSQCIDFIYCLYKVANKFPEETKEYNLIYFIDSAKTFIE